MFLAFCYFVNFNSGYLDCYASAYGDEDNTTAYSYQPIFGDFPNVTSEFRGICIGGIFLMLLHMLSTILHCIKPLKGIASLVQCLTHTATWIWFLTATTFRFRWSGRVCSGDFTTEISVRQNETVMFETGYFMKVWILLWWALIPFVCCISCLCCNKGKKTQN